MKKYVTAYKIVITLSVIVIVFSCLSYRIGISPVSKNSEQVTIEIKENSTYLTIASLLKENDLIRSELFYKIYIKIFNPSNLQKGTYILDKNMGVEKIIDVFSKGSTYNPNSIKLTFNEGINMRRIAKIISENTNNTEQDVYDLLKDNEYLDSLIEKYWFIDPAIKEERIYYSLEGYLFPDTYEYMDKDVSVKEIFHKMLEKMDSVLSSYKKEIENNKYNVHEILTLASIIELEAANGNDRDGIAGVFFNRLESNWPLGTDVTTFYAIKVDIGERELYQSELDDVNDYNTRASAMAGKLPISPICIPSEASIRVTLNPTVHDYYFFVADKNNKTYFTKTYSEHNNMINYLKKEGLWYVQ